MNSPEKVGIRTEARVGNVFLSQPPKNIFVDQVAIWWQRQRCRRQVCRGQVGQPCGLRTAWRRGCPMFFGFQGKEIVGQ